MGRFTATLGAVAAAVAAMGIEPPHTLAGVKLETPPVIDGIIDTDVEWSKVPSGTGMVDQITGQSAPVETQFWLAYDDKYIYFAAKLGDPDPKGIKATNYRRNVDLSGDDWVSFYVDPFGNLSDVNTFVMNARGACTAYIAGGRAMKNEWLGEYVAKARVTATGWEAEARIPWAIMSLPAAGPRTLRVNACRYYSHTGRFFTWCFISNGDMEQYGKWSGVSVPKADSHRTLHLLPFGYLGAVDGGHPIAEGGLDMKTALTDQLELVGSVMPDFRNVEESILSLDYTHYQRFAGESRPFFLEGSNYLDPTGAGQFISQRIPDFDVGMKLYGKMTDKTTIGVLDANTLGESNAWVASALHSPDHFTQISATGTSYDAGGKHNQTGGLALTRQFGPLYLLGSIVGSDDTVNGRGSSAGASLLYHKGGWSASGGYQEVSPSFDPALGYAPYVDYRGVTGSASYDGIPRRGSLREITASIYGLNYEHSDGTPFQSYFVVGSTATWRNGTALYFGATQDRFQGVEEHTYTVAFTKPTNEPNRNWSLTTTWGSLAGADYFTPTLSAAYRPVEHLQVGFSYQYRDFNGVSDLAILTARYEIGMYNSFSARIVEQDGHLNAYAAFNRTGNKGVEYYLILGDPNALDFRASVIFKVTIPFEIRL